MTSYSRVKGEDDEDDNILRDGQSLRVSFFMLDEVQRSVAASSITDALNVFAGHRPGYCFAVPVNDADAEKAWEARGKWQRDAWINPPSMVAEPRPPARSSTDPTGTGSSVGSASRMADARDAQAAWEARGEFLRNAWKHPHA